MELHSQEGIPTGRTHDPNRDAELDRNTLHVRARGRRARDDGASAHFAEELDRILADVERGAGAREQRRLGEADRQPALGGVVDESRQRGDVPQERHEPRFRLEVERRRHPAELAEARLVLRARERHFRCEGREHEIAIAPSLRHAPDVLDETDRADDRRRVDRPSVRLVVERDVPGHDRSADRLARSRDAVDRRCELPRDLGLLGIPEVEAVREADRLTAHAGDVACGLEHRERTSRERIEPRDAALTVQRERETTHRRPQAENRCVEAGAADRPRPDELVVAAEHELTASKRRRGEQLDERLRRRAARRRSRAPESPRGATASTS